MNLQHAGRCYYWLGLVLCIFSANVLAADEPIADIHLVLNSLTSEGDWWGATEVYVWDEDGELVTPLTVDAERRRGSSNNFDSPTGALHALHINDQLEHTGWVPKDGGRHYDNAIGAATLNIHLPRKIAGGLLAVVTWPQAKKLPQGKTSAGIASGRIFFRYGGPTTFHDFNMHRNPGGVGAPDDRFINATYFGATPKRR